MKRTARRLAPILLAAPLLLASLPAAGQPGPTPPEVVSRYEPGLPADLRAKGHQGEVRVSGTVKASGDLTDIKVISSSGSADLDAFAVKAFQRWRFKPGLDAAGVPVDRRVSTGFEFWADGLETLGKKSCAEFVADIAWHRATFPDKADHDMRLYNLIGGMFLLGGPNKAFPSDEAMRRALKALPAAWPRTYEACQTRPKTPFFAVLIQELKR